MAQVELVVTEPARIVALVTRDAVEELGLQPGHERHCARQVDVRDGASSDAPPRRARLACLRSRRSERGRGRACHAECLCRSVADGRVPEDRLSGALLLWPAPTCLPRRSCRARRRTSSQPRTRQVPAVSSTRRASCSKPVVFATNTLVLIVPDLEPRRDPHRLRPAPRAGSSSSIGASRPCPIGGYTRQILEEPRRSSDRAAATSSADESDVTRSRSRRSRSARPTRASSTSTDAKTVPGKVTASPAPCRGRSRT